MKLYDNIYDQYNLSFNYYSKIEKQFFDNFFISEEHIIMVDKTSYDILHSYFLEFNNSYAITHNLSDRYLNRLIKINAEYVKDLLTSLENIKMRVDKYRKLITELNISYI